MYDCPAGQGVPRMVATSAMRRRLLLQLRPRGPLVARAASAPRAVSSSVRAASSSASSGGGSSSGSSSGSGSPIGGEKYEGFEPGREWVPLDPDRIEKGEARRAAAAQRRRRWERSLRPSSGAALAVVCHGNIARSQVFSHCLDARARACQIPLHVSSCGVAEEGEYPHWPELIAETERRLAAATPPGLPPPRVTRDWWSEAVAARLLDATLILAADAAIRSELVAKLGPTAPPVLLYHEFSGDGPLDFVDTYDPATGGQDPERYSRCFVTLEDMAAQAIADLERRLDAQEEEKEAAAAAAATLAPADDGVAQALLALAADLEPPS
jgi:protein-tyrosine-phosphatase